MTTKTNAPAVALSPKPLPGAPLTPAWTLEERLQRIQAMGQRINGYVEFMCKVGSLGGTSCEAKEEAVTAFYDRMVIVERQLGKIQENLELG